MISLVDSTKYLRKKYYQFYINSSKTYKTFIHFSLFYKDSINLIPKPEKAIIRKGNDRLISLKNTSRRPMTQ